MPCTGKQNSIWKSINTQGHPCGIDEKAHTFALQRVTLFSHFINSVEEHFFFFKSVEMTGSRAPYPTILVHWHTSSMWLATPKLSVSLTSSVAYLFCIRPLFYPPFFSRDYRYVHLSVYLLQVSSWLVLWMLKDNIRE